MMTTSSYFSVHHQWWSGAHIGTRRIFSRGRQIHKGVAGVGQWVRRWVSITYRDRSIYTSLFTKDGSISRKEKYTYKQKYTINKND